MNTTTHQIKMEKCDTCVVCKQKFDEMGDDDFIITRDDCGQINVCDMCVEYYEDNVELTGETRLFTGSIQVVVDCELQMVEVKNQVQFAGVNQHGIKMWYAFVDEFNVYRPVYTQEGLEMF